MDQKKRRLTVRTIILLLLGAALVFALYTNLTKDRQNQVQKGSQAPDFVLTDMNDKQHRLSDYKGQGVLLNFWGTWCKPCESEMPFMERQYQVYQDQGVQILAVNIDESAYAVNRFIDKHQLSFPVLIDKGEVATAYHVGQLPVTFLIDKEGKVIDEPLTGSLTEESIQQHMERIKP